MTIELFREDSYLQTTVAEVERLTDEGVVFDQTVFYPVGGGQPGDQGELTAEDGRRFQVSDTRKDRESGDIVHIVESTEGLRKGDKLQLNIDWQRRFQHMRMHTCLHLLCSLIDAPVTGGNLQGHKGRLDFALAESPDKEALTAALKKLIEGGHPVSHQWITDAEMDAQPELVRTLSVQPPRGAGKVRLVKVAEVDLQPCGGTHVANTREIGMVKVGKIENKGKSNRRINLQLLEVDG